MNTKSQGKLNPENMMQEQPLSGKGPEKSTSQAMSITQQTTYKKGSIMKNPITLKTSRLSILFGLGLFAQTAMVRPTEAATNADTTIHSVIPFAGGLTVTLDRVGKGRPVLVLHGGGGPGTVAGFVKGLSANADVLAPTIPGFSGTVRPQWFTDVDDIALTFLQLLDKLDLKDVVVVGFSVGGWIAAEMAVMDSHRIAGVVLVDGLGIQVEGETILDVFRITQAELFKASFYNPAAFAVDPSKVTPEQTAERAANFATLAVYCKDRMQDPKLRLRLAGVKTPALVVWGEADGVASPNFGRAYAQSFQNGRFELITESGHNPQLEQPAKLMGLVQGFRSSLFNSTRLGNSPLNGGTSETILHRTAGQATLSLGSEQNVSLTLVSASGRVLAEVFHGVLPAGMHRFAIPAGSESGLLVLGKVGRGIAH